MELFTGFGLVGIIALVWGGLSLGAGLVIWAVLVASKGLRPEAKEQPRVANRLRPAAKDQPRATSDPTAISNDERVAPVFSHINSGLRK